MKVYVSGPLHGSRDLRVARDLYDSIALELRECGHEPYVPHHSTDPQLASELTSEEVCRRDLKALSECDAIVAHIGAPSTGVGAEIAIALQQGMSVLGIRREHETASRFAEGLIEIRGGALATFSDTAELSSALRAWAEDSHDLQISVDSLKA
jgi:nucleoside 2-deoxyribosyltransferase